MNQDQPNIIHIEPANDRQLVYLRGELCLTTAEPVRQALAGTISAAQPLVLDLSDLTGIDLCGLQLLCSAQHTCQRHNLPFSLRDVPEWFPETVQSTGFQSHPAFRDAMPDAIEEGYCG